MSRTVAGRRGRPGAILVLGLWLALGSRSACKKKGADRPVTAPARPGAVAPAAVAAGQDRALIRKASLEIEDQTSRVQDILDVQRELTRVQSEIDALVGQLKHLGSSVTLAEVTLEFRPGRILGPLGYAGWALWWVLSKLFMIR